jgi:hypothetical protein
MAEYALAAPASACIGITSPTTQGLLCLSPSHASRLMPHQSHHLPTKKKSASTCPGLADGLHDVEIRHSELNSILAQMLLLHLTRSVGPPPPITHSDRLLTNAANARHETWICRSLVVMVHLKHRQQRIQAHARHSPCIRLKLCADFWKRYTQGSSWKRWLPGRLSATEGPGENQL